jgi:transcriptional repressor NrdR
VRCPDCGHTASKVVDSRGGPEALEIRRRRECESCGGRFTTYERLETAPPMVVKRDGRREAFDPEKLRRALRTACRKRPVSADVIERMVGRVTRRVGAFGEREVDSEAIGRALLDELAAVDEVSYARFASVYLRFESFADFDRLLKERSG